MIAFVPQLHQGEEPESAELELRTIRLFCGDGSSSFTVFGAPAPGPDSARAALPGGGFAGRAAGPSAGQAAAAAGLPSRSFPHPDHREHHVSGYGAARLPEEAERSSRTGKHPPTPRPTAFSSHILISADSEKSCLHNKFDADLHTRAHSLGNCYESSAKTHLLCAEPKFQRQAAQQISAAAMV